MKKAAGNSFAIITVVLIAAVCLFAVSFLNWQLNSGDSSIEVLNVFRQKSIQLGAIR